MQRVQLGIIAFAAFAVACASSGPRAEPISGPPADLDALVGEWIGEYHTYSEAGRSGTLLFRLEAGEDTIRGDVLMHIAGRETAPLIPFTTDPWANVAEDQLLSVTFVRAAGGTVYGELAPYEDPICGCLLHTAFTGRVRGNLLEGTYTSEHVNGGDRATGRWRVVRTFQD